MTHWTRPFLTQALDGVPKGTYRKRLEVELTDHLTALAEELEGQGYTRESAQVIARERMGDPAALAEEFLEEWRQRARKPSYFLPRLGACVGQALAMDMLCDCLYMVHGPLFSGRYLAALASYFPVPELAEAAFYAALTFLPGLIHGVVELNRSFAPHPWRRRMTAAGLLLFWGVEKLIYPTAIFSLLWLETKPPLFWLPARFAGAWAWFLDVFPAHTFALHLWVTLIPTLLAVLCWGLGRGQTVSGGEFV